MSCIINRIKTSRYIGSTVEKDAGTVSTCIYIFFESLAARLLYANVVWNRLRSRNPIDRSYSNVNGARKNAGARTFFLFFLERIPLK